MMNKVEGSNEGRRGTLLVSHLSHSIVKDVKDVYPNSHNGYYI